MSDRQQNFQEQRDRIIKRGLEALRAGDFQTAGQIAETAVAREPNDLSGLALLCNIHMELQNYGTALALARMALQVAHAAGCVGVEHWYNVYHACRKTWQKGPALEALDKAAALAQPTDADIPLGYSSFWITYGDPVKAAEYAQRAVDLDSKMPQAHTNLGQALLSLDRWEEAWPHMEHRKALKRWTRPVDPFPAWTGQKVDTLIVHCEQGLGDELQYLSLLHRIADKADRIVVECAERLVPLLRRSLGCDVYGSLEECAANGVFDPKLLAERGNPPPLLLDDSRPYVVACATLPLYTNATRENCADNAYLLVDPARAIFWRARLTQLAAGRPIIAVAWRGGTYENHELLRNPPAEMFASLSPQRYCLVSVQYGRDDAEKALHARYAAKLGMHVFQQAIDDIDEQAALIKACDKLVTVAQTAMHIGGAVGADTLALIGQYPKWDCGQAGDAVPWWKSVKAIRQRGDDWSDVFDRLRAELGEKPSAAKMERFGSVLSGPGTTVDLTHIDIGGADASPTDLRAAE